MERTIIILATLAAACGSVSDRGGCAVSTDCPAGQYCAQTPDGSVCWADAVAPVVSEVTAACAGGCRRDSVLHVAATVGDATGEVLDASVTLDLAGGPTVPMVRSGAGWEADVDLRRFPFDHFERSVVATVTARDGARNASAGASAAAVNVTRLRWVYDAGAPITPAAIMSDGTVVVGVSATTDQVIAVLPSGTQAWTRSVGGTSFVTAAPAIGAHGIWIGSEDFSLRALKFDGTELLAGLGVAVGGGIKGSVAVTQATGNDWAFVTSAAGFVGTASSVAQGAVAGPTASFTTGPAVGTDGTCYAATATGMLRAYRLVTDPAVTLTEQWSTSVAVNVSAPLAIDMSGYVWTGGVDGKLSKTLPSDTNGTATLVASLPGSIIDSPIVLSGGDIVVGDQTGRLRRYSSSGSPIWTPGPDLGGSVYAPIALIGGDAALFVPTGGGKVFSIRNDGTEIWSAVLESGKALRGANIHTPPGQEQPTTSTAYVSSESGKLFAVVVDGQLDASAPWPKAFHDPKNTNRAGPQP